MGEKIKKLNNSQKKGIIQIISEDNASLQNQSKEMQIDLNKMTFDKLKQLEKYLNDCINDNNMSMSNLSQKSQSNKFIEEEKEDYIIENDELSSCLSDDDEDDEE